VSCCSTNEELQATLQELADLQVQLTELQADNERLTEEKSVLLESLCRQTEKLEDSRTKVDTLQELLLHHDQAECCTEREQKLVELLKVLPVWTSFLYVFIRLSFGLY
jgi:regulator of replication initiation timing